ncbi:histidine phosphotransferase HPT1 [Linderina pennispora]|uniref:Histidine phosphotransferase HPT1 n=1 Tax=Linderina pennispora TaxID=61395 RepID=A0A1Y1W1B4_9FUNG|nr:histidine phosphotransferase HPT1 [Linderina pennispora]KAJ1950668.1 Phosphorelay intermediate protein [Linderina pennispora]ORX67297.1 histidine phosphotransferase HPT1 [Linderina pennispora]
MSTIDGDIEDDELGNSILDLEVFDQLISMDDEDDEFSQQIVYNYFEQAETTFSNMDKAIEARDLARLSELGHFLKGSSASIGVKHVRDCCEHIQHLGRLKNSDGVGQIDEEAALKQIVKELDKGKSEYQKAREFLRFFYEQDDDE